MADFPTSITSADTLAKAVNNASTSLSSAISSSATTIPVTSTALWGSTHAGYITIEDECIAFTGFTGNSFTGCTRGSDGTTAVAHASGYTVFGNAVAAHHNKVVDELAAIETSLVLTASKAVVTGATGRLAAATATATEVDYLSGVTSGLQAQIDALKPLFGWVTTPSTLTYASATSFTVTGDQTSLYRPGTRICLNGSVYCVVVASAYSAVTTCTTLGTAVPESITSAAYSYQESPLGLPTSWSYTPAALVTSPATYTTGFTTITGSYWISAAGRLEGHVDYDTVTSTPGSGTQDYLFPLPYAVSTRHAVTAIIGTGVFYDSSTTTWYVYFMSPSAGGATTLKARPYGSVEEFMDTDTTGVYPMRFATNDSAHYDFSYYV